MRPKRKDEVTSNDDLKQKKKSRHEDAVAGRRDPSSRGIHRDGIKVERSKSNRSTCVTCKRKIEKEELRWGVKYAGNPITGEPVLPLYGSHPMYMWNHASCGFSFGKFSELERRNKSWLAMRTCHLCEDSPRRGNSDLRLRCGGPETSGGKIHFHHFHLSCVKKALDAGTDTITIHANEIDCWEGLSAAEKEYAKEVLP